MAKSNIPQTSSPEQVIARWLTELTGLPANPEIGFEAERRLSAELSPEFLETIAKAVRHD